MANQRRLWIGVLVLLYAAVVVEPAALAHISVDQGGTHKSRYGDGPLKDAPCGMANGSRGTNVYTYAAGQKIQVSIVELIPHPSYFRIAFDDSGDDAFAEPKSIEPIDPARLCPFNAADQCGASDFYNNAAVLADMDNLNPHVSAQFGAKYTWDVTLPETPCDNCTLQIIQVMEDTSHGAYNPKPGDPNDVPYIPDIYHQCIDLVLQAGSDGSPAGAGATSAGSSADEKGCSCSVGGRAPAQTAGAWALALAFCALRIRRTPAGL